MARPRFCIACSKLVAYGPSCMRCVALSRPKARKLFLSRKWQDTWSGDHATKAKKSYRIRTLDREL